MLTLLTVKRLNESTDLYIEGHMLSFCLFLKTYISIVYRRSKPIQFFFFFNEQHSEYSLSRPEIEVLYC